MQGKIIKQVTVEGDIGELDLTDVIDIRAIQDLTDYFYEITNIGIGILDIKGNILVSGGWQDICSKFHRTHPDTCANCLESDTHLAQGVGFGTFKLYRCRNGMWDAATAIVVGGKHLGNLYCGQFFFDDEKPDYEFFRAQARRCGFNEADYLAALDRVPRRNRQTMDTVMGFFIRLAGLISSLSFSNIRLARSIDEREALAESLRESEKKYRNLVENAGEVILIAQDGLIKYVNDTREGYTGYARDELIESRFIDYIHPDDRAVVMEYDLQRLSGRKAPVSYDFRMIDKSGEIRWINFNAVVTEWEGKPATLNFLRDITDQKRTEKERREMQDKLLAAMHAAVEAIAMTTERRDPYTAGHQKRVSQLAGAMALEMGLTEFQIEGIELASSIHDIGKINVPADILSKPRSLNELEFGLVKEHSLSAYNILKTIDFPWPIAEIVLQHHERLDGSGYPAGLTGEDICLEAKILAVADVVEAMASHRPHRPAHGIDVALQEIKGKRAQAFDAVAVDACLRLFNFESFKFD
ncbi:MAG: PocR ligand-binding domain-containing protein [Dehalococcoidia bacterium]|nr:PocR ligand-binding domain-containing protein [Dehalococcoidia bacterium]